MQIQKATMEQLREVAAFYDKVTAYLVRTVNYPKWTPGEYPGEESARAAIKAGTQYLCMEEGMVVGAFVLNDDPQGDYQAGAWSCNLADGEYMVLHALAADPASYHHGLGRQMVEYSLKTAKENGYRALRLDVVPDNIPARRLYESMGFSFAGEKDLARGIPEIPTFVLYEWVLDKEN